MAEAIDPDGDRDTQAVEAIVDVLLLAIIRGNPSGTEERKRLTEAKKALFGTPPRKGRPEDHDIPELLHMARAYLGERGRFEYSTSYAPTWPDTGGSGFTSPTQLAANAIDSRCKADPAYKPHHKDEKIRNLQKKFEDNRDRWLAIAGNQDGDAESVFRLRLRELREFLAMLGVKTGDPADPLRDVNRAI